MTVNELIEKLERLLEQLPEVENHEIYMLGHGVISKEDGTNIAPLALVTIETPGGSIVLVPESMEKGGGLNLLDIKE
jgi:hypothetical protein